ncbi:unnamed protein product [Coffea canephora]|uniref:Uncharacterized protein n=1 Tax=Coffea canephora TaxID=49390 RepID=A0A068UC54_COFCA|nr:unnamed protein product [Coffea canephora]
MRIHRIKSLISKFTLNWTDNSENSQSTAASGRSKLRSSDFHRCKLPSKFHGKSVICMLYVSIKPLYLNMIAVGLRVA